MKNKSMALNLAGMFLLLLANFAEASTMFVVDTGAPNSSGALTLYSGQWLAAEFQTANPLVIDGIEGFIQADSGSGVGINDQFTITLYQDAGGSPDLGNPPLFSQQALLTVDGGWNGLHGLSSGGSSLMIGPGTYWVAFEVQPGDTLSGLMPVSAGHLARASYDGISISGYQPAAGTAYDFGVRIEVIPETPTLFLFMGGLAILVRHKWRQSKAMLSRH